MSTQEYPLKHCHRDSPWLGSEVSKDGVCPTLNEAVSSQLLVHGRIAIAGTKRLHGLSGSKVECWSGAGASNSGRLSAWDLKITFPHSHHTESHWMGAAAVVCMCVCEGGSLLLPSVKTDELLITFFLWMVNIKTPTFTLFTTTYFNNLCVDLLLSPVSVRSSSLSLKTSSLWLKANHKRHLFY